MFQQPRKWPGYLAGAVLLIFAINNPEKAAHLVNQVVHAITSFANALGH
jgi:hypothetical protein